MLIVADKIYPDIFVFRRLQPAIKCVKRADPLARRPDEQRRPGMRYETGGRRSKSRGHQCIERRLQCRSERLDNAGHKSVSVEELEPLDSGACGVGARVWRGRSSLGETMRYRDPGVDFVLKSRNEISQPDATDAALFQRNRGLVPSLTSASANQKLIAGREDRNSLGSLLVGRFQKRQTMGAPAVRRRS